MAENRKQAAIRNDGWQVLFPENNSGIFSNWNQNCIVFQKILSSSSRSHAFDLVKIMACVMQRVRKND